MPRNLFHWVRNIFFWILQKTKNLQVDLQINLPKEKSKKGSAKLIEEEDPSYISPEDEIVPTSENDEQYDSVSTCNEW